MSDFIVIQSSETATSVQVVERTNTVINTFPGGPVIVGGATFDAVATAIAILPVIPQIPGAQTVQQALEHFATTPIDGGTFF